MGWFRSNRASADDLAELRARIDELTTRLDRSEQENAELRAAAPPPTASPPPEATPASESTSLPEPPVGATPLVDRHDLDEVIARVDLLEHRLASVATELANQLDELSGELDGAPGDQASADRVAALEERLGAVLDEAVADIRRSTEALAAEQARYEIQFRADLAEVADRTRR